MPGSSTTGLRRASTIAAEAGLVGTAALVIAFAVLKLWHADVHVPFTYNGDGIFNIMLIKGIVDNGWFQHNPHLGFPFGQNLLDYPSGADHLHFLAFRIIALGTSSPAVIINIFYIATYAVNAMTAYVVLRVMGRLRTTAAIVSLLFAFLPYHVFRGENHVFLSAYQAIPLAVLLLFWVFQPQPIIFQPAGRGLRLQLRLRDGRTLAAIAIALSLGAMGAYYAVFAALLLLVAGLVGIPAGWGWRRSLSALTLGALVAVSLVGNLAPSVAYRIAHGTNLEATHKDPLATEAFGLKIAQLVMPVQQHRIGRLAAFQERSYNPALASEGAQQLGAVGAFGFLALLVWAFARLARRDAVASDADVAPLAFGTILALLCGTIGGFSLVFALLGLTEIRSWNRISLVIAFCSFAFFALLVERGTAWLKARRPRLMPGGVALPAALLVFLVGAIFDETSPAALPNYAAAKTAFVQQGAFVHQVEARLPRGAAVFQLPYIPFPETPYRFGMNDYDHIRGYLHSRDLKWSYGEVKGRHGDWQGVAESLPPEQMIPAVIGAGFSAIWVDTAGYEDHGAALTAALAAHTGPPIVTSPDNRWRVFDLAGVRARLDAGRVKASGDAVLHPVELAFGRPWGPLEFPDGHQLRRTAGPAVTGLNNTLDRPRAVTARLLAQSTSGPQRLAIRTPDGVTTVNLDATLQPVTLRFILPAGGGQLRFVGASSFAIADVHVLDDAIAAASDSRS